MGIAVQNHHPASILSWFDGWFDGLRDSPEPRRNRVTSSTGGSSAGVHPSSPGTVSWGNYSPPFRRMGLDPAFNTGVTGSAVTPSPYLLEQTSATNPDDEMALLTVASEKVDELAFIQAANTIDWSRRSTEDYLRAVRLALSAGAYVMASKLSAQGAAQYPGYSELQKFARLLAPPKILPNTEPPNPTLRLNRDWLMAHGIEYRGRWVALKAGQLLGQAPTLSELIEITGDPKGKHILLTQV
jgi:hypothetical protein